MSTPPHYEQREPWYARYFWWLVLSWPLIASYNLTVVILLVTPWVSLFQRGLSTHSDWYWAVAPRPGYLAGRAGICAAAMLAIVFGPWGWIQRTRAGHLQSAPSGGSAPAITPMQSQARSDPQTETARASGSGQSHAHAETQSAGSRSRDAMVLVRTTAIFLLLLIALIGVFAGTDMQAAHDHPSGASDQCFSVGLQHRDGSVGGQLRTWDALYFATGTLTTAGTGSIAPLSTRCRGMVTVQTAIGATVILLGIGGVVTRLLQSPLLTGERRGPD